MPMIDTHCHLSDRKFVDDLDEVIKRAVDSGVSRMIAPATDLKDSKRIIEMIKTRESVYGLVGVYPGNAEKIKDLKGMVEDLKRMIREEKVVGIGEIGMDGYWNKRSIGVQKEVFKAQIELAVETSMPIVVHSRDAGEEIRSVFEEIEKLPSGQFHCYGEDQEFMEYVLNRGFFVSFCGNVTYKSNKHLRELVRKVPLDKLLLETDSPYLAPEGERGSRNEPKNVKITASFLADLHGTTLEEIEAITEKNTNMLFNKLN